MHITVVDSLRDKLTSDLEGEEVPAKRRRRRVSRKKKKAEEEEFREESVPPKVEEKVFPEMEISEEKKRKPSAEEKKITKAIEEIKKIRDDFEKRVESVEETSKKIGDDASKIREFWAERKEGLRPEDIRALWVTHRPLRLDADVEKAFEKYVKTSEEIGGMTERKVAKDVLKQWGVNISDLERKMMNAYNRLDREFSDVKRKVEAFIGKELEKKAGEEKLPSVKDFAAQMSYQEERFYRSIGRLSEIATGLKKEKSKQEIIFEQDISLEEKEEEKPLIEQFKEAKLPEVIGEPSLVQTQRSEISSETGRLEIGKAGYKQKKLEDIVQAQPVTDPLSEIISILKERAATSPDVVRAKSRTRLPQGRGMVGRRGSGADVIGIDEDFYAFSGSGLKDVGETVVSHIRGQLRDITNLLSPQMTREKLDKILGKLKDIDERTKKTERKADEISRQGPNILSEFDDAWNRDRYME